MPDAPPNELRVAIVAARDLAIKDKNLLSRLRQRLRLPVSNDRSDGVRVGSTSAPRRR